MFQKNPPVALMSLTKASRVQIDTPGKPPDPASIRYGGKTPKSERTAPAATVPPAAGPAPTSPAAPVSPTPLTAKPTPAPVAPSPAPSAKAAAPVIPPTAEAACAPAIPLVPPTPPPGLTTWPPTRAALDDDPPPSRRSLASRYDVVPYGPGLLPDPGPPTGPEHWGLNCPPPGGPVLALVGQYGPSPRHGTAPLLSVSFACNFGLRASGLHDPGLHDPGGPFSVGVIMPTAAAPFRPDLGQLIGFALREAAASPHRFRPGTPGAAPDTLTLLLHFVEPGGEPLRGLFGPPLSRRPLPARLVVRVPDLAGGSYKVTAEAYDAGRLPRSCSLANAQCFLAIDRGREAAGDMGLVADLVADPAALLWRDPERYGRAAAQMARLLILGRRPYRLPLLP